MEEILTASVLLYHSTTDKAHYLKLIMGETQKHIVISLDKEAVQQISKITNLKF